MRNWSDSARARCLQTPFIAPCQRCRGDAPGSRVIIRTSTLFKATPKQGRRWRRRLHPSEISAHIASAIRSAQLVTLRNCGHFAYLECAADLGTRLRASFRAWTAALIVRSSSEGVRTASTEQGRTGLRPAAVLRSVAPPFCSSEVVVARMRLGRRDCAYSGFTFSALGPFGP